MTGKHPEAHAMVTSEQCACRGADRDDGLHEESCPARQPSTGIPRFDIETKPYHYGYSTKRDATGEWCRWDDVEAQIARLRAEIRPLIAAARSWHDFHHGSQTVQCDAICEALPRAEAGLAGDNQS